MPCTCFQGRGKPVVCHLVEVHNSLNHFLTTRRFDLLYQAPWISGAHAIMNLARVSACGAQLWHYGYFVGTVLHVYNALVQCKLLEAARLPILETLCNVYEGIIFLGKRSINNLLSCWQRWAGGTVMRAGQHQRNGAGLMHRKWHLCAVPDASHGSNDKRRSFSPAKVSLFSLLVEGQYVLDDNVRARMNWSDEGVKNVCPEPDFFVVCTPYT